MIEHFIYMLPLLILLSGTILFAVKNFAPEATPQCFKFCRLILLASFVLHIIFYNKPMLTGLSSANHLTLLYITWLYGAAFLTLFLARRWYGSMKQSGAGFCGSVILAVIAGCLLIVSKNLCLSAGAIVLLMLAGYQMLSADSENNQISKQKNTYLRTMQIFFVLIIAAIGRIYYQFGAADYIAINRFLSQNQNDFLLYGAVCVVILAIMFLMAAAPLHYWLTTVSPKISLPVLTYFLLMPVTACLGGLVHLNMMTLPSLSGLLQLFCVGIGIMSVFVGSIGACSSSNIRQISANSLILQIGIVFLVLQHFSLLAVQTAMVYWFVCWLAFAGLCVGLFCFKIKGEYLFRAEQFANASYQKPYAALMITLFLFSQLGLPPLTGALGLFAVLNELAAHNHFYILVYILMMLLVLGYAYLKFVQTLYFANGRNNFDRSGVDLYVLLFIVASVMAFVILQPHYLVGFPWLAEIFYG